MKLDTTQHKIIHMGAPERSERDPVGYIMKKKKTLCVIIQLQHFCCIKMIPTYRFENYNV